MYLKYLKGSLTCHKIIRRATSDFTSHLKEGVLWIFIALKNPSLGQGLNPQPLGPMASTLTTTQLRQLECSYFDAVHLCSSALFCDTRVQSALQVVLIVIKLRK
jgi:hypothetical protein